MTPAVEPASIRDSSDVSVCRRRAAHLATLLGFPPVAVGGIAILATELAENVLRHGGGRGRMTFTEIAREDGRGIEIVCTDSGPGFDARAAFADGFSTAGTLGIGLGAVARLADTCEVRTPPEGVGAMIIARKWLPQAPRAPASATEPGAAGRFDVGARSRPFPGHTVNGDAYVVRFTPDGALAAVIDGLGHGVEAHEAARAARDLIENTADQPLDALFRDLDGRLRRTRGAVAAIARIDLHTARLSFAGVGNVEAVLRGAGTTLHPVSTSGIIGHNMRPPRLVDYDWTPESLLVLCSDGVRTAWRAELEPALLNAHPDILADTILAGYARETDDATVLGIRQKHL